MMAVSSVHAEHTHGECRHSSSHSGSLSIPFLALAHSDVLSRCLQNSKNKNWKSNIIETYAGIKRKGRIWKDWPQVQAECLKKNKIQHIYYNISIPDYNLRYKLPFKNTKHQEIRHFAV